MHVSARGRPSLLLSSTMCARVRACKSVKSRVRAGCSSLLCVPYIEREYTWQLVKGSEEGAGVARYGHGAAHPSSFLGALPQGDADASRDCGNSGHVRACTRRARGLRARGGNLVVFGKREEQPWGEKRKGERPDLCCPRHVGRHKARNPWEYRACASVRSCAARVMGWTATTISSPPPTRPFLSFSFLFFSLSFHLAIFLSFSPLLAPGIP